MKYRTIPVLAALVSIAWACRSEAPGDRTPIAGARDTRDLPRGVAAMLDSGNASYRAKDFESARAFYRKATELAPREPSAWFGVHMAELALGDSAAADSAIRRAADLSGQESFRHPPIPDREAPEPADSSARSSERTGVR